MFYLSSIVAFYQILKFHSYFLDTVIDQGIERERVRRCRIFFYLEDDTMQVVEPGHPNSGIPQGKLGTLQGLVITTSSNSLRMKSDESRHT